MTTIVRIALAALALATVVAACTPSGSTGLVPATHYRTPMDGGGGFPPQPTPLAPATP
ncbi:MAG TPA: hypothetical protein VIO32_11440 [Candidatus Baltobacteraceae bacterium]